ncbi:MAG: glycosyltransferase [Pseudomonadota bacterium]
MQENRTNLFQFWDQPIPPDEVAVLMDYWEREPGFLYSRFDAERADAFVGEHFGMRARAAYRTCGVPAMKADLFRYCVLYQKGGLYVDADTAPIGPVANFISDSDRGVLMNREVRIANDFLFVRQAKDPLLAEVIQRALENIEARASNNVWKVTGPGIMTSMHSDPERRHCFNRFDIRPLLQVEDVVKFVNDLEYKSSKDDWRHILQQGTKSIFK